MSVAYCACEETWSGILTNFLLSLIESLSATSCCFHPLTASGTIRSHSGAVHLQLTLTRHDQGLVAWARTAASTVFCCGLLWHSTHRFAIRANRHKRMVRHLLFLVWQLPPHTCRPRTKQVELQIEHEAHVPDVPWISRPARKVQGALLVRVVVSLQYKGCACMRMEHVYRWFAIREHKSHI